MAILSGLALAALLNAIWQTVLTGMAASVCAWLVRRSPARQFVVWLVAFALCLVAPLASLRHYRGAAIAPVPGRVESFRLVATAHLPVPIPAESLGSRLIVGAYVVSVLWAGGRLTASWWSTRRIVARARPADLPSEILAAAAKCWSGPSTPPAPVLRSALATTPFTYGVTRPVIVLPDRLCEGHSADALLAVLGHEIAHVSRRDFLWNAMVESLFPLLAFHPGAHWIRRGIRTAREFACDDLVAANLLDGSRYAASLLDVALQTASAPALNPSLGSTGSGGLEDRVRRLVLPDSKPAAASWWLAALGMALLLGAGAASFAFAFQPSDPRDYTGVWRVNWAAGHVRLPLDSDDCCFQTLEIRYQDNRFSGTLTNDSADTKDGRFVRAFTRSVPLLDPHLDNGILEFHQKVGSRDQIFEVTMDQSGRALVRSHLVQEVHAWTPFARVR